VQGLSELERAVLDKLLEGDHPQLAALRGQLDKLQVAKREVTGSGFFCDLDAPAPPPVLAGATFMLDDVEADLDGLTKGASFVLVIKKGRMTLLECLTRDEAWPATVGTFALRYVTTPRDLDALG